MAVEETVRRAIATRAPLSISYAEDEATRTVHPHVLFRTCGGRLCFDAYQVAGPSSSDGPVPGWRLFRLDKTRRAEVLEGRFRDAPGYDPASPEYRFGLAYVPPD